MVGGIMNDLTGKKFGRWTVLERDYEIIKTLAQSRPYWKCQCECGTIKSIRGSHLTSGTTLSCGCLRKDNKIIDISGQRFGKLIVIGINKDYKNFNSNERGSYWNCLCDCGNECIRSRDSLIKEGLHSCNHCLGKIDLTGERRNMLVAMYPVRKSNNGTTVWHCKCDCGNEIDYDTIQFNTRKSCGCTSQKSKGEIVIEQILKDNNIKYIFNKVYFKDLILSSGYLGRYDFILLDENNNPYRIIEFDGEQHYKENPLFSNKATLQERQHNDKIKNQYALSHNIPLVRIPYYYLKRITLKTIIGDEFLIE